ncbi:Signal transduction histidine kinase-related protein [Penicillium brevicompactum]
MSQVEDSTLLTTRAHEADRQAREVYRYFQPANPAALNAAWIPRSAASELATDSSTLSSPNTTLTSFAQQAAIRLNAQRAFITILNHDSQFIVSEATKTTNSGNSMLSTAEGDELFAGTSTLPNAWNICWETVSIASELEDGTFPVLVVNDLTQEERFKQLPFVEGEPHSRFYAGTPLITDNGIKLGCLFVLDSQPRDGLSESEKDALGTVAAMVMDYLHVSRQAVEGSRAARLSQGLRCFVDGKSSFSDNHHMSRSPSSNSSSSSRGSTHTRTSRSSSSQTSDLGSCLNCDETGDARSQTGDARSLSAIFNKNSEGEPFANAAASLRSSRRGGSRSSISSDSNDRIFQRAANILRQGLDLHSAGGVVFLKVGDVSPDDLSQSDSTSVNAESPAPVLSISTRDDPLSSQENSSSPCAAASIDKVFLDRLSRRYPKGRLCRVESVITDRQKGDFISSISHELRSPLHGVLAATEFLGDTHLDDFQESLLETINACGRTLLDTMNQVLDFSKIMSLERQERRSRRRKDSLKPKLTEENPARMDPFVATNVATLTEEVVDSVHLGHSHMKQSTARTNRPKVVPPSLPNQLARADKEVNASPNVEVIVNIASNDWVYKVQPGSLRRLIMNLLGNALKYTEKGLISVCVEANRCSKGRSRRRDAVDMVTLTISDTGKGISSTYLRTRLYTPFSQEDNLSVGTGLGLSIVRGIVDTLDGSIDIQSRVGEGTVVKVSIPLERPIKEEKSSSINVDCAGNSPIPSTQLSCMGLTKNLVAFGGIYSSSLIENQFWSSIAQYVTDWYGMKVVPWSANEHVDFVFVNETDLSEERVRQSITGSPNLLVFYNEWDNSGNPSKKWSHLAETLGILRRPCGPQRLARGILGCLNSTPASRRSRPPTAGLEFAVPERPKLAGPSPMAETLTHSSPGHPDRTAAKSLEFTPDPQSNVGSTGHDNPGLRLGTEISGHTTSTLTSSASLNPTGTLNGSRSGPRILLVDDNDINLRLTTTFMDKRKVPLLDIAQNGREAVECVEGMLTGYDLIFMDISMPIMDGNEATRAIRTIEKARDGCDRAKIIAFTSLSSSHAEATALDSGVDLFLTKPVSFKKISRLLNEWETEQPN